MGRLAVALLVCFYFALLIGLGGRDQWARLGVPARSPSFLDMRSVTTGWECTRRGIDVLPLNPCDPLKRPANYPRVWMRLSFLGLGEGSTVALALFVAAFLFIRRVIHSPFGQVLKAIRENEPRMISLGYEVQRYKLVAFVLSAVLAGLAGAVKAQVLGFATLSDVSQATSGEVVLMALVGGTGTFLGPAIGAAIVVTLQEYLSDLVGAWVSVIIGAVFVVCVMVFRRGFVGEIQRRFARRAD